MGRRGHRERRETADSRRHCVYEKRFGRVHLHKRSGYCMIGMRESILLVY